MLGGFFYEFAVPPKLLMPTPAGKIIFVCVFFNERNKAVHS
jgi:hypothetical protein